MIDIAKMLLVPGTVSFAVLIAFIGVWLVLKDGAKRRIGMALLVLLGVGYFVLALPLTAEWLSAPLIRFDRLNDPDQAQGVVATVVLGGDSQQGRIRETLRLVQLLQPQSVIVSGSLEMRDELVAVGVAPEQLVMETVSKTTHEQAVNVARLVRSKGFHRIVLVASAIHMPRALSAFRCAGIDAIPSASATHSITRRPRLWPDSNALQLSSESIYEYAALAYYRWRGWLAPV